MSELNIRELTEGDADELAALEAECFSCPWSRDSFAECLNNGRFYFIGLFEDDLLIGYGGLMTVLDEGDVANIAVRANRRGRGYGKMLLTALEAEAKNRGTVYLHLEVRESNAAARRLYERSGFITDGIRKNYYQKPLEDAVLMTKKL